MIRIPQPGVGRETSTRVELRFPDPSCNPYLAFAVMLEVGMSGVDHELDCPPPVNNMNIYEMTGEELAKLGAEVFIRIGSCGGVNPQVQTGDVVVATGAVRDDLTSSNYAPLSYPAVATPEIYSALLTALKDLLPPDRIHAGIVWSTDIYYDQREGNILDRWTRTQVQCVEMESSLLFVFAQTKGLQAGSILACDGNLHSDPKGEQTDESEASGEQHPLLVEAVTKEIQAAVTAVDELFASK